VKTALLLLLLVVLLLLLLLGFVEGGLSVLQHALQPLLFLLLLCKALLLLPPHTRTASNISRGQTYMQAQGRRSASYNDLLVVQHASQAPHIYLSTGAAASQLLRTAALNNLHCATHNSAHRQALHILTSDAGHDTGIPRRP
jgi:hypothetical protein